MRELDRAHLYGVLAGFAVAALLGGIVVHARTGITSPSMIDDWAYAGYPAKSLGYLAGAFLHPIGDRFRPAFEWWNDLQWHTLGAPGSLTGPHLWGYARMLLFMTGLVLVPGLVAAAERRRPGPVALACLCAAAGATLLSGPWTNTDFFRLAPQEPVLFGASACGLAVMLTVTRRWIEARSLPIAGNRRALLLAAYAGGLLLWLLGVYQKEASICLLAFAPFLYLFLDRRWRENGLLERALWRARPFRVTAALLVLPVLHVAIMSLSLSGQGASLYGAKPPSGLIDWIGRAGHSLSLQWDQMDTVIGTSAWRVLAVLVIALLIGVAIRDRGVPWLPLGLVVTGWCAFVFQGIPLLVQSRYFIVPMALWMAAAILLLAQLPRWIVWAATVGLAAVAIVNVDDDRRALDGWKTMERDEAGAVYLIATMHPASCPVYMRNVDLERAEALLKLLPLVGTPMRGRCEPGFEAVLVGERGPIRGPVAGTTPQMGGVCARQSLVAQTNLWQLVGCRRLRARVDGIPAAEVLRVNRVVPGADLRDVRPSAPTGV